MMNEFHARYEKSGFFVLLKRYSICFPGMVFPQGRSFALLTFECSHDRSGLWNRAQGILV